MLSFAAAAPPRLGLSMFAINCEWF